MATMSLVAAFHLVSAGSASGAAQGSACFNFDDFAYSSRAIVEEQLDRCFPIGSNVRALLSDLVQSYGRRMTAMRLPSTAPEPLRGLFLSQIRRTKALEQGYSDTWIVRLVTDGDGRLQASEVELLLSGRDVAHRKVPFLLENFTRRDIEGALADLLRYKSIYEWRARVTPERIGTLLQDAGAALAETVKTGQGMTYVYTYEKRGRFDIASAFRVTPTQRWIFEFDFDDAGRYLARRIRLPGD